MERHFHEQLDELKDMLVEMAASVEEAIADAIRSLMKRDTELASRVIEKDDRINRMEIRIDNQILKLLALQQPVAVDLRSLTSAMKINNDLERMGDHAVNIAERAACLSREHPLKYSKDILKMARITQSMVQDSIKSYIQADERLARDICRRDDEVDAFDDRLWRRLLSSMTSDAENVSSAMNYVLISKNLERIGDLSTNIAEEVIFIYKARNIKHRMDEIEDIRSRS